MNIRITHALRSLRRLLLIVAVLTASPAFGKTYTIGVESVNNFPHYDFTQAEPRGYLVDLMQAFAKEQNIELQFKVMSVDALWNAYLKKEVDFRLPDNHLWQRQIKQSARLTYSVPLVSFTDGVMSLSANKGKPIQSLGIIAGFTAWPFKEQIESGEVVLKSEAKVEDLIHGLLAGKYDGVYYNVEAFEALLKEAGVASDQVIFRNDQRKTQSLYMLSSIEQGPLVLALNQYLKSNRQWVKERKTFYNLK